MNDDKKESVFVLLTSAVAIARVAVRDLWGEVLPKCQKNAPQHQ
jgi:hypothetical protein